MTFKYRYKKQIIIGVFVVVIFLVLGCFLFKNSFSGEKKDKKKATLKLERKKSSNVVGEKISDEKVDNTSGVYVDIKGEVASPGTYLIDNDKRVKDVIDMAGGLSGNADTSVINLSKKVKDEMVIIIYSKWQVQNFVETKEKEKVALEGCKFSEDFQLENDACIDNSDSEVSESNSNDNSSISLNNATREELMTLTGIGEAKADDIINYRNSNGGFKTIEEIKNVKGIGDAVFAKIKDRLTL